MFEVHPFTDCKSLYDHIHKEGAPWMRAQKRLGFYCRHSL